jgi:predicted ATPase/Tfp pilus assembly protein PilF
MTALLTLLYTDIEGSTALNTRLGDAAMAELWARHDRGSRELMRRWRGREIDRSDGFLALFDSVTDAAAFAADYHAMLAALPVPLRARAGLHLGPLALRNTAPEDVALGAKPLEPVGMGKAISARLMALAQGAQTLLSPQTAAALSAAGWRCHSHGHWRFKGLDAPLEVFELLLGDAPSTPPPDAEKAERVVWSNGQWSSQRSLPHSLPAERDSFVGRDADLQALAERLRDGARLLTLLGPGGVGKTRLALRHAWAWRGEHPGGVWFCDLSQARSLDGLLQAVAQGLDVPLSGDPVTQLGRAIAGRERCLLILDNFEQVTAHAAETLGRWLDAAPAARFVATSRERLGLAGESTLALASMVAADAVELFHQRAMAANSGYRRLAADEAVVGELVDLLDGLPLAIELAAARVRVMSPAELMARMGDRFRLLASDKGRPERQATLYAALQWSWELLSAAEQSALAQMSVFEGGFDWAAAEAVVDLEQVEGGPWLMDVVHGLADKSLLRVSADGRFGLLRSIAEFAAGKLARAPSPDHHAGARWRHARHYAGLSEGAATVHRCVELDNLVAACRTAAQAMEPDVGAAALANAWSALSLTGPYRTALALGEALRACCAADDGPAATVDWVTGCALHAIGQAAEAQAPLERALRRLRPAASPSLAARVRCALGDVLAATGRGAQALPMYLEAHALAREVGHVPGQCQALNALGALDATEGRLAAARARYEAALVLAIETRSSRWQGGLLGNLGGLHYAEGRLNDALQAYERALAITSELGDRQWEGNTRCNLGLIRLELGDPLAAREQLELALALAGQLGHQELAYTARCNLGIVMESLGDGVAARAHHTAAVQAAQTAGHQRAEGQFREYLGRALARDGLLDEALDCLRRGLELLQQIDDRLGCGLLWCSLADTLLASGRDREARESLAMARRIIDEQDCGPQSELSRRAAALAARWPEPPAALNRG